MERIFVTGGAGFIGSHICDQLLELGFEVICLDNLISGSIENIKHLMDNKNFMFVEGDIRNYETCLENISGCSMVCHQAALGSVPRSVEDPITTNSHNVTGTLNVFNAARNHGIRRIVFASSSSCYGDEESLPKVEDVIGTPLSPYAVSKRVSEMYSRVFHELYSMEMIGLRYFNVFGPRQNPEGMYAPVIPKFAKSLIHEKSPTIFGDGLQSRDFTFVSNVVDANIASLFSENKDSFNRVYNIACGGRLSINEIFQHLKNLLSQKNPGISKISPTYKESRLGDVLHSHADISLARKYLGYDPSIDVMKGLELTIDSYWDMFKH